MTIFWTWAKPHLFWIILIAVALFLGHLWLQEHDARAAADAQIKTAQSTIAGLQKQQTAVAQAAKVEVTVLQKAAAEVKTSPAAVQALTTKATADAVDATPLKIEALPDAPDKVTAEALPLYQKLNACKIDGDNLAACTKEIAIEKDIDTQKDVEIAALKQKPSFWHRVKSTAIEIGIGAAVGYAVAKH